MDGKETFKVPIYTPVFFFGEYTGNIPVGHVYVDLKTGKSKKVYDSNFIKLYSAIFNEHAKTDGWLTLKQVDEKSNWWPHPFKNALRNLYPELTK